MATESKIKEDSVAVPVAQGDLDAVSNGTFYNPHEVLGGHLGPDEHEDVVTIRVLRPLAKSVTIITENARTQAVHEHNGVFMALIPAIKTDDGFDVPDYRISTEYEDGSTVVSDDPYRYLPTIGDLDMYLFGEGRHERLWEALGARVLRYDDPLGSNDGVKGEQLVGTAFTVWAPNAHAVRVVGDFNGWNGRTHAMRELGSSGVWELFIPGVEAGTIYKYEILNANNEWVMKADPMERSHEIPPRTGSIVVDSVHAWHDENWMDQRAKTDPHNGPVSIYEVHASSWRKDVKNYRELADKLVPYVQKEGFTHVEFMPLAEHPFSGSWGYQVTGYYAIDSRLGGPDDFKYLVEKMHEAGIGVIMDWVPAHFPKDAFALGRFDGTPLYEDPDPTRGEHPDWGTYVMVHVYNPRGIARALKAGVRSIEHGHLIDEPTMALLAESGAWLSMQAFTVEDNTYPSPVQQAKHLQICNGTDRTYRLAKKHGVKLAWGTDLLFDPANTKNQNHGIVKLQKWFTNFEILRMVTCDNARLLALSGARNPYPGNLGVIEEGALADLLVIEGNPLERIEVLENPHDNLRVIVKDGVVCKNTL